MPSSVWQDAAEWPLGSVALGLEWLAAATIAVGAVWALVSLLRHGLAAARATLSQALLLALDFTIGADVLKVALAPDLDAVLVVAAIVLVRTVLTLTLVWELGRESKRSQPLESR